MTSESSSALVDLNDADTEDTETHSVTDDAHDGVPPIMEQGYDIAVKVDAPMKQLSTLETYVTYRVRCVCARWATPPYVRRRYNHFKLLHKRLSASHPWLAPPPLPPLHTARQQLDRYSASFVALRTLALHAFLDRVAKHPILTHSEDFRIFLTTPDEELDKVFKSENSAMNLWGLSSALYGSGEAKPTNGARVKDPEFSSAADYLQSLQHKLNTLCGLTTKLYKGTTSLGTEMMGMKRACDAWSCQSGGRAGRAGRAAAGAAAGCGAAAAAARARQPLRHRAELPQLAAYTAAHRDKIQQRDALHAAYVSGNNTTGDLHNRLEQASEALRSELSDWLPKTRSEIKALLLDLAERQLAYHTQALIGWEHALKLSTETNIDELFKTVSKTAVRHLSPSKCRADLTPTETERDLDELENDSNDSDSFNSKSERNSSRFNESLGDWSKGKSEVNSSGVIDTKHNSSAVIESGCNSSGVNESGCNLSEVQESGVNSSAVNESECNSSGVNESECNSSGINESGCNLSAVNKSGCKSTNNDSLYDNINESAINYTQSVPKVHDVQDALSIEGVLKVQDKDFISEILSDPTERSGSEGDTKMDSTPSGKSLKSEAVPDPLRDFCDVDLS